MNNITGGVKSIEDEAEKTLEQARTRAGEILSGAREESQQITSAELSLDEVKAQSQSIIKQAQAEADKQVKEAREQSRKLSDTIGDRTDGIVKKMIDIVTGAE